MTETRRPNAAPASGELFDELLVVMAQRRDPRAAERLYQRWHPRLQRAARRYCGSEDALGDLVQECWLAIWKGLGGLRDPARFRSYAFAVLHRRGADHLRKVISDRARASDAPAETAQQAGQSDRIAITQAFDALPPDQRLAAHLFFVEGLTLAEIAAVQDIPEGTAKSRLFHARRKLKAALDPTHEGEVQ